MLPVDGSSLRVEQVEHIPPVAPFPLEHVELAPDQLLHGNGSEMHASDGDLPSPIKPILIHLGPMIGHGPDGIDDDVAVATPINPGPVVGQPIVMILEPSLRHCALHCLAVCGQNVEIEILGISEVAGVRRRGKRAAQGESHVLRIGLPNGFPVDIPLRFRNAFPIWLGGYSSVAHDS
jgi:hypothetical protein